MKKFASLLLALSLVVTVRGYSSLQPEGEKEEILSILDSLTGSDGRVVGMIIGIVDEKGERFYSKGWLNKQEKKKVDENTMFEIGSVTKVFTAILLADMVIKGELSLEDSVSDFLPPAVKAPAGDGGRMKLKHLAAHTSGLPRMPSNFYPADRLNPYKDYTVEKMYNFFSSYRLDRESGARFEYSNFGMGLLGHILVLETGQDYESLVAQRILVPLGMSSTTITLDEDQESRFASPHDSNKNPVKPWDIPVMAGAGALRSTASDMLKFLAANLGLTKTPLIEAMELSHRIQHVSYERGMATGLAWHLIHRRGADIIWHGGGTGGFRAYCGFSKEARIGIIILTNTVCPIDNIGNDFLISKYPKRRTSPVPSEARLSSSILESYTGEYRLESGLTMEVYLQDGQLYFKLDRQEAQPVYPQSETAFFFKDSDAALTFKKDSRGNVLSVILEQKWMKLEAIRIE